MGVSRITDSDIGNLGRAASTRRNAYAALRSASDGAVVDSLLQQPDAASPLAEGYAFRGYGACAWSWALEGVWK